MIDGTDDAEGIHSGLEKLMVDVERSHSSSVSPPPAGIRKAVVKPAIKSPSSHESEVIIVELVGGGEQNNTSDVLICSLAHVGERMKRVYVFPKISRIVLW